MESDNLKSLTRVGAMNRSRRRQSALISFGGRWRGLTSAATKFMESLLVLVIAGPLLAHAQLEIVPDETTPLVFAGQGRSIQVRFRNSSNQEVAASLRTKLLQASSSTTMPVSEPQAWKQLRVLAGQTILESAKVGFPAVKAGTRFIVQWLDDDSKVLGTTDVMVYPPDLLKGLQPLLDEKPLGVFDPKNLLKPLLQPAKLEYDDFQETGWENFAGRLALIGPFTDPKQAPAALHDKIKALANRGVAVVWMQPPSGPLPKPEPVLYGVRVGSGHVVVVPAKTVFALNESPLSQLNLVRLAEWAMRPDRLELPQLKP